MPRERRFEISATGKCGHAMCYVVHLSELCHDEVRDRADRADDPALRRMIEGEA